MVPTPRKIAVKVGWRRLGAAAAGAVALASALYFQHGRIATEFWAARLDRLGDERSVVKLAKLARGSDYALEALARRVEHPSAETRALVACALAEFPRAREALIRARSDPDERVSSQARFALRILGEGP